MSKDNRKESEQIKQVEKSLGPVEAVISGVQAIAPGLSLSKILGDITTELKEQWNHGRHEISSAMFTGNAYVQYARKDSKDEQQQEQGEQTHVQRLEQEQSRGGREL